MKANSNEHKNVTYLKLPPYVAQFFCSMFASKKVDDILHKQIITIPFSTELHACIKASLVENSTFVRTKGKSSRGYRNNNSFSAAAVTKAIEVIKSKEDVSYDKMKIPMKQDLTLLVPLAIPNVLWRNETEVHTNDFFELTHIGAINVRRLCVEFFWAALTDFLHNEKMASIALQKTFNLTQSTEKFLVHYGIDPEMLWSVYMVAKRNIMLI